jgi:Meiotically up-regulated gene 113
VFLNTDDGRSLIFSFEYYDGKDYLVFYYSINDFKISIGNKISFLFEDNIKHTFNVVEKSIRSKIVGSKLYETKVQITSDELKSFSNKNLLKWKIEDTINNTSFICEAKNLNWYTKDLLQAVTKNLATEYINLVAENDINYSPLIERVEIKSVNKVSTEECYVYLMIDTTNNFHKIGISNNPRYREKTLQSDKPTIELLHKKSFPNRKIAEVLEKTLHMTYSNKRIRGEWFDLDNNEINEIILLLN